MRKSDYVVFVILNSIYLFAAALVSNLLGSLVIRVVEQVHNFSFDIEAIVHATVVFVGMIVFMAIMTYGDGYRYAIFDACGTAVSAAIAALIHFGLGVLFRFAPVLFGPTRHFSGLVAYGAAYTSDRVAFIPVGVSVAVGAILVLAYVAVMVVAGYLGCRKRLRDRAQLMTEQPASK